MSRVKVSLSLDPQLLGDVDAFVEEHAGLDRSKVVDSALRLWAAAQQEAAMELQFADERDSDARELESWRSIRREAARRTLGKR